MWLNNKFASSNMTNQYKAAFSRRLCTKHSRKIKTKTPKLLILKYIFEILGVCKTSSYENNMLELLR